MRHLSSAVRTTISMPGICVMLLSACGCGGAAAPQAGTQPEVASPPSSAAATAEPAEQATLTEPSADDPTSKTKWIGGIPYDVFFDQPLVIAADASTLAPSMSTPAASTPPATGMEPEADPDLTTTLANVIAADDGPDWAQLISADVLNEAVTKLRNSLTTNLNTLATYNRNIEAIADDGSSLAALAAIAEVHPDAVSWKDNARFVRDLGYTIYQQADGTGRGPFDATKEPFEQVVAILNGGPPPDIEALDQRPFADVADRSELMKRIKRSYNYLRAEINTEPRFQESPDDIIREASVLASFGGLISTESYDSADEEKYQQFVRDFMQANLDVVAATRADDFSGFEAARNRVQKACDACHGEYAFGGDSF